MNWRRRLTSAGCIVALVLGCFFAASAYLVLNSRCSPDLGDWQAEAVVAVESLAPGQDLSWYKGDCDDTFAAYGYYPPGTDQADMRGRALAAGWLPVAHTSPDSLVLTRVFAEETAYFELGTNDFSIVPSAWWPGP